MTITDVFTTAAPANPAPALAPSPAWVLPMRITTVDRDVIHGAQWPDGRIYAWDADTAWVGAWADFAEFQAQMQEEGSVVEWSGPPAGAS